MERFSVCIPEVDELFFVWESFGSELSPDLERISRDRLQTSRETSPEYGDQRWVNSVFELQQSQKELKDT